MTPLLLLIEEESSAAMCTLALRAHSWSRSAALSETVLLRLLVCECISFSEEVLESRFCLSGKEGALLSFFRSLRPPLRDIEL